MPNTSVAQYKVIVDGQDIISGQPTGILCDGD